MPMAPSLALDGNAVLVTGANSGIGRQIAIVLAQNGADVAVHYLAGTTKVEGTEHSVLGRDAALAVADAIHALGRHAVLVEGDLAEPGTVA